MTVEPLNKTSIFNSYTYESKTVGASTIDFLSKPIRVTWGGRSVSAYDGLGEEVSLLEKITMIFITIIALPIVASALLLKKINWSVYQKEILKERQKYFSFLDARAIETNKWLEDKVSKINGQDLIQYYENFFRSPNGLEYFTSKILEGALQLKETDSKFTKVLRMDLAEDIIQHLIRLRPNCKPKIDIYRRKAVGPCLFFYPPFQYQMGDVQVALTNYRELKRFSEDLSSSKTINELIKSLDNYILLSDMHERIHDLCLMIKLHKSEEYSKVIPQSVNIKVLSDIVKNESNKVFETIHKLLIAKFSP